MDRPDPEALLKRVMAEEERSCRGRLKLFLGYASRVGKTRALLDEMCRRQARGQDVLVGWVQDDDDPEVRRRLAHLCVMPPLLVDGQPTVDVDGIVSRRPQVCVIDGLAHANPPGARYPTRWQDVVALLEAGVNVTSAVNVQYIESLQGDIERLLGIRKQVSVPDAVVRMADEVVLVDLSEAELEQRFSGGGPRMSRAQLSSLREMALLYTADAVDQQVEDYRHEHHIEAVWGTHERLLVCVTPHGRGPGLVERGRRTAERMHADLYVVYVSPDAEWSNVTMEERTAVQTTLALARTYQARVEVLEAKDAAAAILEYAHAQHITQIFVGHGARRKIFGPLSRSIVGRILRGAEGIDVHVASDLPPPPSLSMEMRKIDELASPRRRRSDPRAGRLKVYLGYAAGVGKTFQMLRDGIEAKRAGRDVVVGYFEPHARPDTIAQLADHEVLPRRVVEYRERVFEDMDVDAVLARRPEVCLVDELAHTNVPGSAREKRWQDVQALLEAGLEVWTTVNIQHLESLNDCVQHVTGVRVRETVPDQVLSTADEVVVVDLTTRALLNRLKRGVVYAPDKAEVALRNFFREGSLSALRELALRQTADAVESARNPVVATVDGVMACIGDSNAATIVRRAKRMADRLQARCYVVHVETRGRGKKREGTGERSRTDERGTDGECASGGECGNGGESESGGDYWSAGESGNSGSGTRGGCVDEAFALARQLNVETVELRGPDVARALLEFARTQHVTQLFMGRAVPLGWREFFASNVVERVVREARGVDVHVVADR